MKLGIYVGSFNPVHKGHIAIVNHLIDNNYIDKVLIIPTGNYWGKNNLINIKHRINMLEFYESDNIIVDKDHNDIQYTYELLNILKKIYKDDTLYLIIGADNITNLDRWKNYEEILKQQIIVINRDNIDINSYINNLGKKNNFHVINSLPQNNISSSAVRNLIKDNKINYLDKYIDKEIINYILKNKLYDV